MADTFEEVALPNTELPQIKLFGKWPCEDVNLGDMSLEVSIFTFRRFTRHI